MNPKEIEDRADEMTRSFMRGFVIGMLVGGGVMMVASVVAFVMTLPLR